MTLLNSKRLLSLLLLVLSCSFVVGAQRRDRDDRYRRDRDDDRWERLGDAHADGRRDHDLIRVNARGGFRAVRFFVQGGDIEMHRVVVHFENGGDTDVEVRDRIRSGSRTRAIDLPGDRRRIRSVEFWYGKENWGRSRPQLVLYGMR